MTTPEQTNTNRHNARKSTGPRTQQGKQRSARNALKHGITAHTPVVPGLENPAHWRKFLNALRKGFDPQGEVEEALVFTIASNLWRLRRSQRQEQTLLAAQLQPQHPPKLIPDSPDLERIIRYERHLHRCLHRDLKELHYQRVHRKPNRCHSDPFEDLFSDLQKKWAVKKPQDDDEDDMTLHDYAVASYQRRLQKQREAQEQGLEPYDPDDAENPYNHDYQHHNNPPDPNNPPR